MGKHQLPSSSGTGKKVTDNFNLVSILECEAGMIKFKYGGWDYTIVDRPSEKVLNGCKDRPLSSNNDHSLNCLWDRLNDLCNLVKAAKNCPAI
ncbi:hypothetical protein RJG79_08160 [Mycoplasmatota bacterium WC44]